MAQPTPYERYTNFTNYQATSPSDPLPAASVDAEFNRIKTTLDQILANLELIQRDDGMLANAIVGRDQLTAAAVAGFNEAAPWVTATAYSVGDLVFEDGEVYYCGVAHTSGTFATDLAASKWTSIGAIGAVSSVFGRSGDVVAATSDYDAVQVDFTPAGSIAATNVQAAIEELDSETTSALAGKQTLNSALTTIAGLTATTNNVIQSVAGAWASRTPTELLATILSGASNDDVIQRKAGVWTNRTMAQLAADLPVYKSGGTDVAIADGGTGQSTAAAGARALLNGLGTTKGNIVWYNGSNWVVLAPP